MATMPAHLILTFRRLNATTSVLEDKGSPSHEVLMTWRAIGNRPGGTFARTVFHRSLFRSAEHHGEGRSRLAGFCTCYSCPLPLGPISRSWRRSIRRLEAISLLAIAWPVQALTVHRSMHGPALRQPRHSDKDLRRATPDGTDCETLNG